MGNGTGTISKYMSDYSKTFGHCAERCHEDSLVDASRAREATSWKVSLLCLNNVSLCSFRVFHNDTQHSRVLLCLRCYSLFVASSKSSRQGGSFATCPVCIHVKFLFVFWPSFVRRHWISFDF